MGDINSTTTLGEWIDHVEEVFGNSEEVVPWAPEPAHVQLWLEHRGSLRQLKLYIKKWPARKERTHIRAPITKPVRNTGEKEYPESDKLALRAKERE